MITKYFLSVTKVLGHIVMKNNQVDWNNIMSANQLDMAGQGNMGRLVTETHALWHTALTASSSSLTKP